MAHPRRVRRARWGVRAEGGQIRTVDRPRGLVVKSAKRLFTPTTSANPSAADVFGDLPSPSSARSVGRDYGFTAIAGHGRPEPRRAESRCRGCTW